MGSSAARLRVVVERLADRDADAEERRRRHEPDRGPDDATAPAPPRLVPPGVNRLEDAQASILNPGAPCERLRRPSRQSLKAASQATPLTARSRPRRAGSGGRPPPRPPSGCAANPVRAPAPRRRLAPTAPRRRT